MIDGALEMTRYLTQLLMLHSSVDFVLQDIEHLTISKCYHCDNFLRFLGPR